MDSPRTSSQPNQIGTERSHGNYRLERLTTWFDGFVVLFTFALTIVSYYQWQATLQSLDFNKKALEVTERAWITVQTANMLEPLTAGKRPTATVRVQNTGHSPATDLRISNNMVLLDKPLPSDAIVPDLPDQSRSVLAPSTTLDAEITNDLALTDEQFESVKAGRMRVYVFGVIHYADIFREPRETVYCFVSNLALGDPRLNACDRWNSFK